VTADGGGVVGHAGAELLRELAGASGLIDAWDEGLLDTYKAFPTKASPGPTTSLSALTWTFLVEVTVQDLPAPDPPYREPAGSCIVHMQPPGQPAQDLAANLPAAASEGAVASPLAKSGRPGGLSSGATGYQVLPSPGVTGQLLAGWPHPATTDSAIVAGHRPVLVVVPDWPVASWP
jgi:hypothetical protein